MSVTVNFYFNQVDFSNVGSDIVSYGLVPVGFEQIGGYGTNYPYSTYGDNVFSGVQATYTPIASLIISDLTALFPGITFVAGSLIDNISQLNANKQDHSTNLDTYSGVSPSAAAQAMLDGSDYAPMASEMSSYFKPASYVPAWTDITGKPTIPSELNPTVNNNVSRTLNSNYTISSNVRGAIVNYSINAAWSLNALLSGSGTATLQYSTDNGSTWITVNNVGKSLNLLTVAGSDDMNLSGFIPSTATDTKITTTATNMTVTYTRGQEVIL